jgi:hypothetical protein
VFQEAAGSVADRIDGFPKFASRQALAKFLARYEIFKKILNVNGSIIECGVLHGGGLLTFAKLSSIFESSNHVRKIIGFDTFEGFPSIHEKDQSGSTSSHLERGGLTGSTLNDVQQAVALFDAIGRSPTFRRSNWSRATLPAQPRISESQSAPGG